MSNNEYLKFLIKFWGHQIRFNIEDDGSIELYRDDDKSPLYKGDSIDEIIHDIRMNVGDLLIKQAVENKR